jgi:protein-disulfide isomerase
MDCASLRLVALGLIGLWGCAPSPADVEELKTGQQQILATLARLEKGEPPPRPKLDPSKIYRFEDGKSPSRGPSDAKVTVVEFLDHEDPMSGETDALARELLAAYPRDVRWMHKQFPIPPAHPNAVLAAKAALAAARQGMYWEMHAQLVANARSLSEEKIIEIARSLGLEMEAWETHRRSQLIHEQVRDEIAAGQAVGVTTTPAVFVNGRLLGNRSLEGLKAAVEAALRPAS